MIWIDWHNSERVAKWAERRLGYTFDRCAALGVVDGKTPIAAMVFSEWNTAEKAMELTVVSTTPRWFHPAAWRALDAYTAECDVHTLINWTPLHEKRWLKLLAIGGAEIHEIETLNRALVIITRAAWRRSRLFGDPNGKSAKPAAADAAGKNRRGADTNKCQHGDRQPTGEPD